MHAPSSWGNIESDGAVIVISSAMYQEIGLRTFIWGKECITIEPSSATSAGLGGDQLVGRYKDRIDMAALKPPCMSER